MDHGKLSLTRPANAGALMARPVTTHPQKRYLALI